MCTAVDGGSIQREARRISAASDHASTAPMASHRSKDRRVKDRRTEDRRKPSRSGALGFASGFSVTFQNNSLGWRCRLWLLFAQATQPDGLIDSRTQPKASEGA